MEESRNYTFEQYLDGLTLSMVPEDFVIPTHKYPIRNQRKTNLRRSLARLMLKIPASVLLAVLAIIGMVLSFLVSFLSLLLNLLSGISFFAGLTVLIGGADLGYTMESGAVFCIYGFVLFCIPYLLAAILGLLELICFRIREFLCGY